MFWGHMAPKSVIFDEKVTWGTFKAESTRTCPGPGQVLCVKYMKFHGAGADFKCNAHEDAPFLMKKHMFFLI